MRGSCPLTCFSRRLWDLLQKSEETRKARVLKECDFTQKEQQKNSHTERHRPARVLATYFATSDKKRCACGINASDETHKRIVRGTQKKEGKNGNSTSRGNCEVFLSAGIILCGCARMRSLVSHTVSAVWFSHLFLLFFSSNSSVKRIKRTESCVRGEIKRLRCGVHSDSALRNKKKTAVGRELHDGTRTRTVLSSVRVVSSVREFLMGIRSTRRN